MRFKEFLLKETPLPDDWDDSLFDERIPFAKRIRYAVEKASKVGVGSSRVAFVIPHEGRKTVLKIAKNKKGLAQNEFEAQMLNDYYLVGTGLVIPMIDYDEKNSMPVWIHTEFATKATNADFKKACGGSLQDLMSYAIKVTGKRDAFSIGDASKISDENEFAYEFTNIVGNYDIPIADFGRLSNWGIYNGDPVIIDLGLSSDVMKQHYSPKRVARY